MRSLSIRPSYNHYIPTKALDLFPLYHRALQMIAIFNEEMNAMILNSLKLHLMSARQEITHVITVINSCSFTSLAFFSLRQYETKMQRSNRKAGCPEISPVAEMLLTFTKH